MENLSPEELARLVELAEINAWFDFAKAAPTEYNVIMEARTIRRGDVAIFSMKRSRDIMFNRVLGFGLSEPATEEYLDEIIHFYRKSGVHEFAIQLSPAAQPANLPDWLLSRGFKVSGSWVKMIRGNELPPEIKTELQVEEVGAAQVPDFATTFMAGYHVPEVFRPSLEVLFGREGWRLYLAYEGEEPVAAGALHIYENIGWLGFAATRPAFRQKGGQGVLMTRRIADAIAAGCHWLVTETGEETPEQPNPSYHNMLRYGFELAYKRQNYILQI